MLPSADRLTGKREVAAWCACSEGGERGEVEVAAQHDILCYSELVLGSRLRMSARYRFGEAGPRIGR